MTRGRKRSPANDRMLAMYESGMSCRDIAKRVGISRQSVWDALKRRGCRFRKDSKARSGRLHVDYGGDRYYWSSNGVWRPGKASLRTDKLKANLSHRVYAEAHGLAEIPAGTVVAFLDGNRRNLAPENLALMTASDFAKKFYASMTEREKTFLAAGAIVGRLNMAIADSLDPERVRRRYEKIRKSRLANGGYGPGARKAVETKKRNGTYAAVGRKISEAARRRRELAAQTKKEKQ